MAVFPTTGSFTTSPTYSGGFIPQLWSNKLNAKFYANTMLSEVSNTDWEGEIKNQGDTIRIRTAPSITINDYAGAGSTLTSEVPVPIYTDMQINKGKYFSVQTNDVLAHQADIDLMNTFTDDAAKQLKISIENEAFFNWFSTEGAAAANKGATAGAISSSYNLGTDAAPINDATAQNVLNTILAMSATMDEQNVPEEGRWLIISPKDRNILMQSNIAQAYFTGDQSSTIRTGKIGMLDRLTVYVSNLLPHGAAGKALVPGLSATSTGATASGAKLRRMMVAGTKASCAFASQITKTEPLRNQTDFGDIVRGLSVYGRKVVKSEALVTALVGTP
ncbi:MAG: hypothetical protein HOE82_06630 [Gammaproteobacteria bacterium]|jgi:hypothetical protein|nr:hypothetical protein [Gammaproteobacteria bacterium]